MGMVSEEIKAAARTGDVGAMLQWASHCIKTDADSAARARALLGLAESRKPQSIYDLATDIYLGGTKGAFLPVPELSTLLFKQAAAEKNGLATERLGDIELQAKSPIGAVGYYTAAAKLGQTSAALKLAYLRIFGLGVRQDVPRGVSELKEIAAKRPSGDSSVNESVSTTMAATAAQKSLQDGTLDILFSMYLLDAADYKKICSKDGTCNIADIEEHFSGTRRAAEYLGKAAAPKGEKSAATASPAAAPSVDPLFEARAKRAEAGDRAALVEWTRGTPEYAANAAGAEKLLMGIDGKMGRFRCFDLGTLLYSRDGDNRLAALWYQRAVSMGDSISAECLARIAALKGDGKAAAEWLKKAADMGNASGLYKYGMCAFFGIGMKRDEEAGMADIRKAADMGDESVHGAAQARLTLEKKSVCADCVSMFLGSSAIRALKNAEGRLDVSALEAYFSKNPFAAPALPEAPATVAAGTPAGDLFAVTAPGQADFRRQPDDMAQQPPRLAPVVAPNNPMADLNALIGLENVKASVKGVANRIAFAKMREKAGLRFSDFNLHFVFSGNPGTGKTTVARILGRILHAVGYLATGTVVEATAQDMIGEYVGTTGPKTMAKIKEAMGGILFIDEAYALMMAQGATGKSFSGEAVAALLKQMEDRRGEFVVVAAGYPEEMKKFVNFNPGLSSRFTEYIDFSDYGSDELEKIFMKMLKDNEYDLAPDAQGELPRMMTEAPSLFDRNFPNARFVRNLYEDCEQFMSNRVIEKFGGHGANAGQAGLQDLTTIERPDLDKAYDKQRAAAKMLGDKQSNPIGFLSR